MKTETIALRYIYRISIWEYGRYLIQASVLGPDGSSKGSEGSTHGLICEACHRFCKTDDFPKNTGSERGLLNLSGCKCFGPESP